MQSDRFFPFFFKVAKRITATKFSKLQSYSFARVLTLDRENMDRQKVINSWMNYANDLLIYFILFSAHYAKSYTIDVGLPVLMAPPDFMKLQQPR